MPFFKSFKNLFCGQILTNWHTFTINLAWALCTQKNANLVFGFRPISANIVTIFLHFSQSQPSHSFGFHQSFADQESDHTWERRETCRNFNASQCGIKSINRIRRPYLHRIWSWRDQQRPEQVKVLELLLLPELQNMDYSLVLISWFGLRHFLHF